MKIKIKSREEIEKTLDEDRVHKGCYFNSLMFRLCGNTVEAESYEFLGYSATTISRDSPSNSWNWHSDWYEVVEPDFTEEDLMDIELMDEMLAYFISTRIN